MEPEGHNAPPKRFLVEAVEAYAHEHDITVELLSGGWIIRLTKNGAERYIFAYDFGLNSSVAKLLARDKAATSEALAHAGVPHVEHRLFLRPNSDGARPHPQDSPELTFAEFEGDVVCKPNEGSTGKDVVRATTQAEFTVVMHELFATHRSIAVSPFVPAESEYRVTVLDDEVLLSYEKVRSPDEPLKFNLHAGARAQDIADPVLAERVYALARKAARALGTRLANVDVFRLDDELMVLEVNASSAFEHYARQGEKGASKARAVYARILDQLFV